MWMAGCVQERSGRFGVGHRRCDCGAIRGLQGSLDWQRDDVEVLIHAACSNTKHQRIELFERVGRPPPEICHVFFEYMPHRGTFGWGGITSQMAFYPIEFSSSAGTGTVHEYVEFTCHFVHMGQGFQAYTRTSNNLFVARLKSWPATRFHPMLRIPWH